MKNKGILILALGIILTAGATPLMADTFWQGTFSGDISGGWRGTLDDDVDPPSFSGSWTTHETQGTMDGDASEDQNVYYVREGRIKDDQGTVIGYWAGEFDYHTSLASGEWYLLSGERGRWTGAEVDE